MKSESEVQTLGRISRSVYGRKILTESWPTQAACCMIATCYTRTSRASASEPELNNLSEEGKSNF